MVGLRSRHTDEVDPHEERRLHADGDAAREPALRVIDAELRGGERGGRDAEVGAVEPEVNGVADRLAALVERSVNPRASETLGRPPRGEAFV